MWVQTALERASEHAGYDGFVPADYGAHRVGSFTRNILELEAIDPASASLIGTDAKLQGVGQLMCIRIFPDMAHRDRRLSSLH